MKPQFIAFDYETEIEGKGSLLFYHPKFRVSSCSFSWFNMEGEIKNRFLVGEKAIYHQLKLIQSQKIPLICHNAQFELGVTRCRFPDIDLNLIQYDTMRMIQVFDNGGKENYETINKTIEQELAELDGKSDRVKTGLGLQSAVSRVLPKMYHNHKEPFYKYLREHQGVRKGNEGKNLTKLPKEMLRAYNVADTDLTLLLFHELKNWLEYDWSFDHKLHLSACKRINSFKIKGVKIDRTSLQKSINELNNEIAGIKSEFRKVFIPEIRQIERKAIKAFIGGVKTENGKRKRAEKVKNRDSEVIKKLKFNPASTKQLKTLFVDTLEIEPTFWTKEPKNRKAETPFEPSPSFRAAHLHTYGEGGEILQGLKKRSLVLKQCENLSKLSEFDGRWHLNLSATGTKTSRYRGSSDDDVKLNCQGLARRDPLLMKCLVADDGKEFLSIDLTAGEPSVTAHYSQDKNYFDLNFGMVGKKPYYNNQGILILDDMYLAGGSVHPNGKDIMTEAWNTSYNGNSFADQWLIDKEVIKKELKAYRASWKTSILAMQYGQGPKGMVSTAYDNGHTLYFKDAKAFHHAFWFQLFPNVRLLGEHLKRLYKREGYLINEFGYRLVPESDHKCLNYYIQSSVSGIIKLLEEHFYRLCNYADPLPVIHDEILTQVPSDKVEQARDLIDQAMETVNNQLGWSIKIRNGFVNGKTLYEAK